MVEVLEPQENSESERKERPSKVQVRGLSIRYGARTALDGVDLDVRENEIFGIIGPANSGKTSFLKALNRMDLFNSSMPLL